MRTPYEQVRTPYEQVRTPYEQVRTPYKKYKQIHVFKNPYSNLIEFLIIKIIKIIMALDEYFIHFVC